MVAGLKSGTFELTDGSQEGDWRLPTDAEWLEFVDRDYYDPALCNAEGNAQWTWDDIFTYVDNWRYWSRDEVGADWARYMYMVSGYMSSDNKNTINFTWPVRDDNR